MPPSYLAVPAPTQPHAVTLVYFAGAQWIVVRSHVKVNVYSHAIVIRSADEARPLVKVLDISRIRMFTSEAIPKAFLWKENFYTTWGLSFSTSPHLGRFCQEVETRHLSEFPHSSLVKLSTGVETEEEEAADWIIVHSTFDHTVKIELDPEEQPIIEIKMSEILE